MNVIKRSCLPPKPPLIGCLVAYLFLDRIQAPEWIWGAVSLFYLILWIAFVVIIFKADYIDIFEKAKEE